MRDDIKLFYKLYFQDKDLFSTTDHLVNIYREYCGFSSPLSVVIRMKESTPMPIIQFINRFNKYAI